MKARSGERGDSEQATPGAAVPVMTFVESAMRSSRRSPRFNRRADEKSRRICAQSMTFVH
jgi:hypothetical protein